MICFIPTKSRPQTQTYKLFKNAGIDVIHFIEPQEYEFYNVENKVNILKNDMGISYVRNFMLNYARENKHDFVIFCDDDVKGFGYFNGKTVKTDAKIWLEILEKAKKVPFEIIGINYIQHAWHEKRKYSVNRNFAEVCVLLNVKNINWNYREEFNTKEDRDFCLQAIKYGNGVLRFNYFFFDCPNVGTNKGGLFNLYKLKLDEEASKKMLMEWSPFISLKRKSERIDMVVDIKGVANFYKKNIK